MSTPCRYPVHSILLFLSVLIKSWLTPKVLEDGGEFVFHPSVLGDYWTEQPSPEYSLLPVQVPSSEFCKTFQKKFRFPNGTLESLKVYDPHMGSDF